MGPPGTRSRNDGGKRLIAEDAIDQTHEPLMTRGAKPVTGAQSFYGLAGMSSSDGMG